MVRPGVGSLLLALALAACAPSDPGPARARPRPRDAGALVAMDAGPAWSSADPFATDPFAIAPQPLALHVERGAAAALATTIRRRSGFDAPIVIQAFGLPPGVRAEPVVAGPHDHAVLVIVRAGQDAEPGERPFSLSAEANGWRRNARLTITVH